MKTIEEEVWEYIDGDYDNDRKMELKAKIAGDPEYRAVYQELMLIHELISAAEPDEPSMSFTRNVMEQVNLEIAPVSLQTRVDKRIIYSIAAFFILSLLAVFGYAVVSSSYSMPEFSMPDLKMNMDLSLLVTPVFIKGFLFLDVVLGLMYLDRFLRRKISH